MSFSFSSRLYCIVQKKKPKKGPERGSRTELNEFWIHHYADHVKYTVSGFVDKNRDILQNDLKNLMEGSKNGFISRTLYKAAEVVVAESGGESKRGGGGRKKKQKTQGFKFYEQLKALLYVDIVWSPTIKYMYIYIYTLSM